MPFLRGVAAGAVIVSAGYGAWLIGGWGGPALIRVLDDVGLVCFALAAALCAGRAAVVSPGREHAAWAFLAAGSIGWAAGELMWSYYDLVAGEAPFPSWADAGYLAFLAGAGMCLILLLTAAPTGIQLRILLDGLIVAAAIFGAAWVTWLQTVYAAQSRDVVSVAFALVYPVVDIGLITVAALLWLRAAPSRRRHLALLAAGLVAIAVSDTAFAYLTATDGYNDHHEIAIGWAWGFCLLGFAAWSAARGPSGPAGPQNTAVSRWLPYVPVLLSAVVCTPVLIAGLGPVFVAVAVIVTAVVIRQFLILAENRRLRAGAAAPASVAAPPMLDELRHAIDHAGLRVVYQPQFDLHTHRIVGMEALIRWPHPCHGLLGPDQFLPLVDKRAMMSSLTRAVLDLALDDAATWYAAGFRVPVAVNVFAPTISDPKLSTHIAAGLRRRGLPPEALIVEITEDRLLADIEETRLSLNALRDRGIRVALDDFGSGYSALWYLRDLPVDQVKLDREFIAPILTHPTSATIVRSVVGMAHALGMTPVAEGVESAEIAALLHQYGCRMAQGFFFSRPLPGADMLALLEAQGRDDAGTPREVTRQRAPDAVISS